MDTSLAQKKLDEIHDLDGDIVMNTTALVKVLSTNPDTVKMLGEILAYIHNVDNDAENIESAQAMVDELNSQLKQRGKLYEDFCNYFKK